MSLTTAKPNMIQVMTEVFRDLGGDDDSHWILMANGTFYTFPKKTTKLSGDEMVGQVLEMSKEAHLLKYTDNDSVRFLPYREFGHPTYVILSCMGPAIGWVVIGETAVWAQSEQEEAAVGYLARTKYEMDCQEHNILATSFPWSANEK